MEKEVFNQHAVLDLLDGDISLLAELASIATQQNTESFEQLREAYSKGELEEVKKHAHAMRGALGNLGAERCHALLSEVEAASITGEIRKLEDLLMNLERELSEFLHEIEALKIQKRR